MTVTKTVVDEDGNELTDNTDNFRIALYAYTRSYDEATDTYVYEAAYDTSGNQIVFEKTVTTGGSLNATVPLGYYWSLSEWVPNNNNNKTAYNASFTVNGGTIVGGDTYRWYYENSGNWINTYRYIYIDSDDASISISIENTQQEVSLDPTASFPAATKTLTGNGDEDTAYTFVFIMRDSSGAEVARGTATVKMNGGAADVTWTYVDEDALTYTSTGTYYYTIAESQYYDGENSCLGVDYTNTTYTMVVTVTINNDETSSTYGQLVASYVIYENYGANDEDDVTSADFVNTYDADDTTFTLVGSKSLTGRTLYANAFTFSIQEYTDDTYTVTSGDAVTAQVEASGRFDHTFTFDEVGTYYFTVTEVAGHESGMDYDDETIYYLKLVVDSKVDTTNSAAVLYVSSSQYATELDGDDTVWSDYTELTSITFSNTYEATGSTTLDVRKYLNGRTFNEDDVFTFRVTAVNGAPLLEVDSNGKAYTITDGTDEDGNECKVYTGTDESIYYVYTDTDGYSYILITVTGAELLASATTDSLGNYYGSATLLTLYYTQSDIGNTYTYRVTEEQGSANGVSYDTYSYGHAVDITVYDAGNGSLYFTKANTADVDDAEVAVVVNTFSQGSMNIYGTKVWVDGDASHTNSDEVTLTLQYLDSNSDWVDYEGDYEVTWGTEYPNNWRILNLPQYDENGNAYVWRVVETSISGYVTTYDTTDEDASDAEAVPDDNSSTNRYTITNTIEQEYTTLTGTKTWVDGGLEHDNSTDVTLIVTRTSTGTGTTTLTVGTDYTVSWSDNTYTITGTGSGLPVYDDYGYTYTYTVTESTTEGQITLTIDGVTYTYNVSDDGQGNITNTREEEDPTSDKTESGTAEDDGTTSEGTDYTAYGTVSVGDEITYTISYYNGNSEKADVTITDVLDDGVTFVSATDPESWTDTENDSFSIAGEETTTASDNVTTYSYGGTVTWTFTAAAFERGYVTLTVQVNENAKTIESDETVATVENQATVTIGEYNNDTDIVVNPLTDDDETEPTKELSSINGTSASESETDGNGNAYVSVGDTVTYTIGYTNNTASVQTVYIIDTLDDGVDYDNSSDGGEYYNDAGTIEIDGTEIEYAARSVVWVIEEVQPFTPGAVTLTVVVNESAKSSENNYNVADGYSLTYGVDGDTTASIANQATVYIGNSTATYTEVVENPLEPDEPTEPTKTVDSDEDDVFDDNGETVSVGDQITYTISYYNHTNTAATVTIVDALDEYVDFVSATDGGEYDADTHTVTWTIYSVSAFTGGTVDLTVEVNSSAETQVENDAVVTVGDNTATTDLVTNPVDDEPEDPVKTVDTDGDEDFEDDGATVSVGDEITYVISYYNYYAVEADIAITDQLDSGVEFVSATDRDGNTLTANDVFSSEDDTYVKWPVFTVEAYERGTVTLTVRVTEAAKTANSSGDATVDNQAGVTIAENDYTTNIVTNPLEPDDPTEPEKTVDVGADTKVSVGDTLVYTISYYNNLSTAATVVIEDALDEGVDFVKASDGGVYDETTHTVTWTIEDVSAFTEGYVTLTVEVNADAQTANNSGTASVVNDADVTVGNQAKQTTDPVENPLDPDDPVDPVKTVSVGDGNAVGIGELITYTIKYYNYNNTAATVTITDVLEDGLTWVSGGTLGADGKTVTWTIEDVAPYTYGTVTVTAQVNSNAKTVAEGDTSAAVENTASVTVGNDAAVDTNTVTNPIDPDVPSTPTKAVSATSAAGADGESVEVGDEITYVISNYNHNNAATTVTITDALDENVTFVSAANENGYTLPTSAYSEADHTVTWTIEAAAYETGTVTVTVKVADSAAGGKIENTASVKIGNDAAVSTNTVTNEVEEVPATPSPTPSSGTTPSTGDESRLGLWIAILAAGALGLACVTVITTSRKKRSEK